VRFLVVPDSAAGEAVAASLRDRSDLRMLPHQSGRPWILGRWREEEVTWAVVGRCRIAVLGRTVTTAPWLARHLLGLGGPTGLEGLSGRLAGSFHAVAVMDGAVFVQGTLSTVREVFYARVAGTTVAADRPDLLASLTGADVRPDRLAAGLVAPAPPWPVNEQCLWNGVETLTAGCRLEITSDGRGRVRRRQRPPAPDVPLAEGAGELRKALHKAVEVRTQGRTMMSADLSGGMDSTSVCFLAAGQVERLLAVSCEAADPAADDDRWAAMAAARLPNADRVVYGVEEFPRCFAGMLEADPDLEGPFPAIQARAMVIRLADLLSAAGSSRHLTGHGGDELFQPNPGYLHDLLRRHPLRAIRQVRAGRAVHRWRLWPTVAQLLDHRSFSDWLGREACRTLDSPVRGVTSAPLAGWGPGYRMPAWATPDAVASVRRMLKDAAAGAQPLSPLRGQHLSLQYLRQGGALARRLDRLTARHGVTTEAPLLDDQVVRAALAVDSAGCLSADRYKPALVEAMRGIVPEQNLGRRSKAEFSAEVYAGLREHRSELLELCEGMRLAELGLVNAGALRAVVLNPPPFPPQLVPLLGTFACEVWLRSLPTASAMTQEPLRRAR
jgi:asparagine synthase (glutamine-hydrolysing)